MAPRHGTQVDHRGEPPASSLIVTVAVRSPCADGVNVTQMSQADSGAIGPAEQSPGAVPVRTVQTQPSDCRRCC